LEVNPEEGLAKEDLVKKQHHKHTLFFLLFSAFPTQHDATWRMGCAFSKFN